MFAILAQANQDPASWAAFVERVGFPGACVFGLGWLLYVLFKPVNDRHLKLVDEVAATNKQMGETNVRMAVATEAISSKLSEFEDTQENHTRALDEIKQKVSRP